MRYIKYYRESESYSVFDSEGWKKFLPKELTVVTDTGNWTLKIPDTEYNTGHATNVTNLMNALQINYYQNTPDTEGGDVNRDGEPDQLEIDITIVKNNDGKSSNPDTLKLNIDITYGNAIVSEFTIEKPNKVHVYHYTGYGSKYDPNSFFGFDDESLLNLIKFFNSWGFQLTKEDFTFLDKYPDSYIQQKVDESIKLNPQFDESYVLIINNSKPQENRYLTNVIKYLDARGISWKIASTPEDVEKINDEFNIIGSISTGSDYRITNPASDEEFKTNEKALEVLDCPIFTICYGMQSLAKYFGGQCEDSGEYIHGSYPLTESEESTIFSGIDMKNTKFSFSFRDTLVDCPEGFKVIGKLGDKICAISNEEKKIFGTLFHPEDIEYTWGILDNFISMCDNGLTNDVEELKGNEVVESYNQFVMRIKNLK